jgi:hypothetical protein
MANDNGTPAPNMPVASQTEGFGTSELVRANEMSSSALAAMARAQIESRYVIALKRPRSWDDVRVKLLKECDRPGFAEVARYSKPVGGSKIEGASIRFAEAALRCMGNATPETTVIWDDEEKRVVRVSVTDVESNLHYSADIVVQKTVERQFLKDGQTALGVRTNSYGKKVYLVRATDDDLLNKQNALCSKALRTHTLRILPGDIQEECMDRVLQTQAKRDAEDPDAARKKLLDAFAAINVMPAQINEYLGHDVSQVVAAELADLRAQYVALRDGETTWSAIMEAKRGEKDVPETTPTQNATAAVKETLKGRAGGKAQPKSSPIDTEGEPVDNGDGTLDRDPPKPSANGGR